MRPQATETADTRLIRGFIAQAIAEFGVNPAIPSIMRGIAVRAPEIFVQEGFTHLQSDIESPGHRHLAMLILKHPGVIELLSHPSFFTLPEAVRISQRFMAVDSLFDVKLARQLPGRDSAGGGLPEAAAERVLDILNEISRGGRIVVILGHLTEHPSSRIAAKATLVLGRRINNNAWIGRHLKSSDFRIRANAVEALWGVDSPASVEAFRANLVDPNNRVVGNAVVGLHLLKADDISPYINRMSSNSAPPFRRTAAWIMGKTAKPEYIEKLHGMMRDETPLVRSTALRALFQIRRATEEPPSELAKVAPVITTELEPDEQPEFIPSFDGSSYRTCLG